MGRSTWGTGHWRTRSANAADRERQQHHQGRGEEGEEARNSWSW